jgi:LysR family glycine cleavage system transcriptional activator
VFEAAARHRSFSLAADELGVTPGAVSQQIRIVEEFAGAPLFRRTGRQVLLSPAGEAVLPLLSHAFNEIGEAARLLRQPARKGRVMVSCAPSFAAKWLAPRLTDFQRLHPDIEVWISADMAKVDFHTQDADFAIRYGRGQYEGLRAERLLSETVLPVCSPALLEGPDGLRRPEDLARHVLLHDGGPEHDPSCPDWESWLRARGITGVDGLRGPRLNPSALVIEAALAGRGVALAKRNIASADLASGRLVAPFADGSVPIDFAYWLVWPKGRHLSREVRAVMDWLKAEAGREEVSGV